MTAHGLPGPESIVDHMLPNGMRALLYENHASPAVVVDGLVFAGALHDPVGLEGLAGFVGEMLERGTRRRSFAQLSETLESIGADIGFGAGRHTLGFDAKCLAEDLPLILRLMAEMLAEPAFPDEQVGRVRGQILTSLRQRADDTRYRASRRFRELAYGEQHPYGRSADGSPDTIGAISRADLEAFYDAAVHPQRGIITMVGAFDTAAALEALTSTVGGWSTGGGKAPVAAPEAPAPGPTVREHVTLAGKVQADVVIGNPAIPRTHPDWMSAAVANAVLGVFGLMGRLGENVRDRRGLAYYAYSRLAGGLGPGPWFAAAGVNPANVDEAIDAIIAEMQRLRSEAIPEAELADVHAFLTGSLPLRLETNEGLAQAIGDMALYDLGLDYLQRYIEAVRAVQPADAMAAAQAHLRPEAAVIVVAGPAA